MLLGLLAEPKAMTETIGNVVRAATTQRDLTKTAIEQLMSQDEIARTEEAFRRSQIAIQNIKGMDIGALRRALYLSEYERVMREAGVPEPSLRFQLGFERFTSAFLGPSEEQYIMPGLFGMPKKYRWQPEAGTFVINDNSVNYYPRVGEKVTGPRMPPP